MWQHWSQLVWFRWFYVFFSRYMWVNEWAEITVEEGVNRGLWSILDVNRDLGLTACLFDKMSSVVPESVSRFAIDSTWMSQPLGFILPPASFITMHARGSASFLISENGQTAQRVIQAASYTASRCMTDVVECLICLWKTKNRLVIGFSPRFRQTCMVLAVKYDLV